MILTRIGVISQGKKGTASITGTLPISPSIPNTSGYVNVSGGTYNLTLSVFGGAGSGSSTTATLNINGNTYVLTATQYQTKTTIITLPVGNHYYTLWATFNGTSGNNATIF